MATEDEELRLTVTLADNASVGLEKLQAQIKELAGGGAGGNKHLEKVNEGTKALTESVVKMTGSFGEAFKSLGMLRLGFIGGVAGLAAFGYEMAKQIKDLGEYTDKIRRLGQLGKDIGVAPSSIKNIADQLKVFGVETAVSEAALSKFAQRMAELQRDPRVRRGILGETAPGAQADMNARIDALNRAGSIEEKLNIARQMYENIRKNARDRGETEERAADEARQGMLKFGYDTELSRAGQLKKLSEEENKAWDDKQKAAENYSNTLGRIAGDWDRISDAMKASVVSGPFSALLEKFETFSNFLARIEEGGGLPGIFKRSLQGKEAVPSEGDSFKDRWPGAADQFKALPGPHSELRDNKRSTDENTAAIKKLTSFFDDAGGGGGPGGGGGGIINASYTTGGGGGFGGGGLGGRGTTPRAYGSDVGPGTGAGAGASTPGQGPMTLGKGDDPRGLEGYIRQTAAKYGVDPDTALRVAKSEGLRDFLGDRGKSGGAFQLYTGGGLGNEFQNETGLDPLDPNNEKATIDYALKHAASGGWGPWHGAKRVGVGPREGLPNGQTAGPGTGAGAGDYSGVGGYNFMGSARARAMGMGDVGPGSAAAHMAFATGIPAGQGPTSILANKYAGTDMAGFLKDLHGAGAPLGDFSGVYANRSKRGGGSPSQHAYGNAMDIESGFGSGPDNSAKLYAWARAHPAEFAEIQARHHMRNLDRSSGAGISDWGHFEWSPTARQEIDTAQNRSVKVDGSGKLTVDVNAPKNTSVGAEGKGLFKSVEINRQTQMSKAARGPSGHYATEALL